MPRRYQRKTETKYKLEDLEKAVHDVRNKILSLGKASIIYSVPKSTIHDYLKKEIINEPKTGRKAIFTDAQETELEQHIIKCSKVFYGLTIEMVRKIAFKFAEVNQLKHNFDKTSQMAGKDWFYGFKKRHPEISLRKPESTSINRITAFNETEVKMFFNNLEAVQAKYHFDGNRIYNVDETGISNVQRNSRILAPKGQKQVGMATSGERGTTTTVVCAFSASGRYVPPFFIFKRKRMNAHLLRGGNADMIAAVSDSGWINEHLFVDWLHHFISFAKPTLEEPILLILDNHESHISLACYLLCRQSGIILLSLPPHTSHRMQPLDLTYFGPIKTAYNRECDLYMASNVGRKITQYEVVELFTKAFNRISNIEKAANGFRAAGIWPIDTTKFDEQFVDVATSSLENPSILQRAVTPDSQILPTSIEQQRPATPLVNLNESIPLTNIVNVPIMPQQKSKQTSRKKHSTVITSTPMKDSLEEKEQKKKYKEQIKETKKTVNTNKGKKGVKNLRAFEKQKRNVPRKKKKVDKGATTEKEYYCLICTEKYEDPPGEEWIECHKCRLWAHENCTSGESTSKGFLCDFCRS